MSEANPAEGRIRVDYSSPDSKPCEMLEPNTVPDSNQHTEFIDSLVTLALEDLHSGSIELPLALRVVAEIAWSKGRADAE